MTAPAAGQPSSTPGQQTPPAATPPAAAPAATPPAAPAAPAAGNPAEPAKPAGEATPPAAGGGEATSKDPGTAGAAAATPKAPATYDLAIPQGAESFVNAEDLKQFAVEAKANDWTQEEAAAELTRRANAIGAQLQKFAEVTAAHPTYGGDKLAINQALGNKVIDRVRPAGHPMAESFRQFLGRTGAANHIEMFAFLADLGRMMDEEKPPASSTASAPVTQESAISKLYSGTK